ncbi:hypothetical protein N7524_006005 [Penicillium chrysogenum]|nr:hypothetical protein N7524_006005 [Penicillium chrysogenum]
MYGRLFCPSASTGCVHRQREEMRKKKDRTTGRRTRRVAGQTSQGPFRLPTVPTVFFEISLAMWYSSRSQPLTAYRWVSMDTFVFLKIDKASKPSSHPESNRPQESAI